jgi:hypothetical protein
MDEGRKRVIGLMAAILSAMHMQRADDLFGMPNGTPITDRIIEASIQWAERIMQRIDSPTFQMKSPRTSCSNRCCQA